MGPTIPIPIKNMYWTAKLLNVTVKLTDQRSEVAVVSPSDDSHMRSPWSRLE